MTLWWRSDKTRDEFIKHNVHMV